MSKYDVVDALERENLGLIKHIEGLEKIIDEQSTKIEEGHKILNSYALRYGTVRDQNKKIQEIKTEAIKKFAEKLKQLSIIADCEVEWMVLEFYDLVKEMTEGNNES